MKIRKWLFFQTKTLFKTEIKLHVAPKVINVYKNVDNFVTVLRWKPLIIQKLYMITNKFSKK